MEKQPFEKYARESTGIVTTKKMSKESWLLLDRWWNTVASFIDPQFKWKCKYKQIQKIIVGSYPKTNEGNKDLPNLKNINYIVFFTIYVFSLTKKVLLHW